MSSMNNRLKRPIPGGLGLKRVRKKAVRHKVVVGAPGLPIAFELPRQPIKDLSKTGEPI